MKNFFAIIFLLIFVGEFRPTYAQGVDLGASAGRLEGTWGVEIEDGDSTMSFALTFSADGSYTDRFFLPAADVNGALVVVSGGTWEANGDSITVFYDYSQMRIDYMGADENMRRAFAAAQDEISESFVQAAAAGAAPRTFVFRRVAFDGADALTARMNLNEKIGVLNDFDDDTYADDPDADLNDVEITFIRHQKQ